MNCRKLLLLVVLALARAILVETVLGEPSVNEFCTDAFKLTFVTPFGTPLDLAEVRVILPNGEYLSGMLDTTGSIVVKNAPLGKINFTVVEWRGAPVYYSVVVERKYSYVALEPEIVIVRNIGKLVVTVVGAGGQGLEGARVSVSGAGVYIIGATDSAGEFAVELPAGTYTVTVIKGGRAASASVSVSGGATTEQTLKVDIFMTIAGWEMSFSEFIGLLLLIAVLEVVVFIIVHDYVTWRRSRL